MFLNFGKAEEEAKEAYFAQAMEQLNSSSKFEPLQPKDKKKPQQPEKQNNLTTQARPKSSVFRSQFFGVYSPGEYLTLRKIVIWLSKNCQNLTFFF